MPTRPIAELVLESALDYAILTTDLEGLITFWSKGAEDILGWTSDEVLGRSASMIFTPEDRANAVPSAEMRKVLISGRAMDERWHSKKDGSRFFASGEMMVLHDGGAPKGFLKIFRDRTPQRQTEERLRKAQGQLQLAVDATNIGIFDYDLTSDVLVWDARTRELFGLPPDAEVSYNAFLAGLHPDDRDWVDKAVQASLDPHGDGNYDVEYRTVGLVDGKERWVAAKGRAFFEAGRAVRLIGTVRDITDQHRAAQFLRQTEERYRLAVKATNDAIWDWDFTTNHVLWNKALETAYGHSLDRVEPTGEWWISHIHPDDRQRIDESIHAVIDGSGTEWADEYRFLRADGTYADVFDRGHVIRDDAGRPLRMIGATLDLTRVQMAEAALRESQRNLLVERGLLQAVVQQAPLGIAIAYADRHSQINTRLEQMLAQGGDDLAQRSTIAFEGEHSDGRPYAADEHPTLRALRDGETIINEPTRHRNRQTGEVRRWEVSSTPVRDAQGHILAAVSIIIDAEDRWRAEEQRTILNHELSHRMKNQMAMVQSLVAQTLRNATDFRQAQAQLIDRLTALSRANDLLLDGQVTTAPIHVVLEQALGFAQGDRDRIRFSGPSVILGSRAALSLTMLLHELTTNAIKYGALSTDRGQLEVSWHTEPGKGGGLFFLVWDERGGPPVQPPERTGFGSRLIKGGIAGAASKVDLDYRPTGLRCMIEASLPGMQSDK